MLLVSESPETTTKEAQSPELGEAGSVIVKDDEALIATSLKALTVRADDANTNLKSALVLRSTPRLALASAAVEAPVPPSATARSVIPLILPPVIEMLEED
jgi:hypothetical protein